MHLLSHSSLCFIHCHPQYSKAIPSKVCALAWKVLLDRIPTKDNLLRRKVLSAEANLTCIFCNSARETTEHLFFVCPCVSLIWSRCYKWLGLDTVLPSNCHLHLLQHDLVFLSAKQNLLWKAIWSIVIWTLWNCRNNVIFRDEEVEVEKMLELIQLRSWNWFTYKVNGFQSSFFEWCSNPLLCPSSV